MADLETLDAFGNNRGTVIEVDIFRDSEVSVYVIYPYIHVRIKHM